MTDKLNKYQYVLFPDGHTEGCLEARWSEKHKAFYSFEGDEKVFSTTIITKEPKHKSFRPSASNCTVRIYPVAETEKCYIVHDGSNGCISRGNRKEYLKTIAKSICYINNDEIFAPSWA